MKPAQGIEGADQPRPSAGNSLDGPWPPVEQIHPENALGSDQIQSVDWRARSGGTLELGGQSVDGHELQSGGVVWISNRPESTLRCHDAASGKGCDQIDVMRYEVGQRATSHARFGTPPFNPPGRPVKTSLDGDEGA